MCAFHFSSLWGKIFPFKYSFGFCKWDSGTPVLSQVRREGETTTLALNFIWKCTARWDFQPSTFSGSSWSRRGRARPGPSDMYEATKRDVKDFSDSDSEVSCSPQCKNATPQLGPLTHAAIQLTAQSHLCALLLPAHPYPLQWYI